MPQLGDIVGVIHGTEILQEAALARLASPQPPAFSTVGIGALLAFFILMVVSMVNHPMHGMILPLELLSTVGNVLSYAQIMAIGIASAVLAMLANQFGGTI